MWKRAAASFKPQLDICSFPRRIPTPARTSLSGDFGGSRRDARQDAYEPRKNGKTRAALTLSKSFLIARVSDGGKMVSQPLIRLGWPSWYVLLLLRVIHRASVIIKTVDFTEPYSRITPTVTARCLKNNSQTYVTVISRERHVRRSAY